MSSHSLDEQLADAVSVELEHNPIFYELFEQLADDHPLVDPDRCRSLELDFRQCWDLTDWASGFSAARHPELDWLGDARADAETLMHELYARSVPGPTLREV